MNGAEMTETNKPAPAVTEVEIEEVRKRHAIYEDRRARAPSDRDYMDCVVMDGDRDLLLRALDERTAKLTRERELHVVTWGRAETAEAEFAKMKAFVESVRDASVGKDDALDVCVDFMKEANALLTATPPATSEKATAQKDGAGNE